MKATGTGALAASPGPSPSKQKNRIRNGRHRKPTGPRPKKRPCLCCGAPFLSSGPGHRLCGDCRKLSGDAVWSSGRWKSCGARAG